MTPVLVVEDEPQIRRFVRLALEEQGCLVHEAGTVAEGLALAGAHAPELVVLDLGLPDGDGLALIRALRGWSRMPVLVLSARGREQDKIQALDAGADDYLTKPFGVGELLARTRALLRRRARPEDTEEPVLDFGEVRVDRARRMVTRGGETLRLTPIEYKLLCHLLANPGRVLTHRQLLREVWGPGQAGQEHYLRVYVGRLRHKLEDDPAQPRHLLTETGVGYRFVP